ncbi:MAG: hypothetical protein WCV93_02475 [Candidatus Shapirobacteria bacterium]|jgi:hypothetical protein
MLSELAWVTLFLVFFVLITSNLGKLILEKIKCKIEFEPEYLVLSYLIGLGFFVNGLIFIGLMGWFTKLYLWFYLGLLGIIVLIFEFKELKNSFKIRKILTVGNVKWYLLGILVFLNYTVCFMPPHAWDELAYHLPEVSRIVDDSKLKLPLVGGLFYGNLPASMEVLYAFGLALQGTSLMHALHYTVFVSLVVFVVAFVKRRYGLRSGLFSGISLFFLVELIDNAVSGYIDAAAVSTEVIGLFMMLWWVEKKENKFLILTGGLWGLSLSIKYSAIYTIPIYVLILGTYYLLKNKECLRQIIQKAILAIMAALAMGGFWYVKNFVQLGNPIYPYFFGHKGLPDSEMYLIDRAVKGFVRERNLLNFLLIPYNSFIRDNLHIRGMVVGLAFLLALVGGFGQQKRMEVKMLSLVVMVNLIIWFFWITHQTRFLLSTLVVIIILASITLSKLSKKITSVLAIIMIVFFVYRLRPLSITKVLANLTIVKLSENMTMFGLMERKEYLSRVMGKSYLVTDYINQNFENTVVLNYWNHNAKYYLVNNNKYSTEVPGESLGYTKFLKVKKIQYFTIDYELKNSFLNSYTWKDWAPPRLVFEDYLLKNSTKEVCFDSYCLYKITKW